MKKDTSLEDQVNPSENAAPTKKSVVVGLPKVAAIKNHFGQTGGQPTFKPKSSKATGAKKRVRQ